MTQPHRDGTRVAVVNALRGLAALWVCWYHAVGLIQPAPSALTTLGSYGFMGVQVFFVVSGFVIPYALHRAHYQLPQYPRFLAKRLLRLHPPYLAVVATIGVFMIGAGMTSPFALAGSVSANPRAIGAASGLYGFFQMGYGMLCTVAVELWSPGASHPVAAILLGSALAGMAAIRLGVRRA